MKLSRRHFLRNCGIVSVAAVIPAPVWFKATTLREDKRIKLQELCNMQGQGPVILSLAPDIVTDLGVASTVTAVHKIRADSDLNGELLFFSFEPVKEVAPLERVGYSGAERDIDRVVASSLFLKETYGKKWECFKV